MITILGAGGGIGGPLARILAGQGKPFRLVGRNPQPVAGAETYAADLTDRDATIRAVAGSSIALLLAGLKYDGKVWAAQWPRIMSNTIEACKRADAKLIFFDNVYMYGRVAGPMTEDTPYNPCSKKGEVRARIANDLMEQVEAGKLTAMIARAADFYGPDTRTGIPNVLVFEPYKKGQKAAWLVNADVPHSLTFTPDAARGVAMLAERDSAWNQVWHLPTRPDPPTGRQLIEMAAREFGVAPRFRVFGRATMKIAGWFNPLNREVYEMLYQNDSPYLFDSSKFDREFDFQATPYPEGVRSAVASYRR
jgi:nucleoside-diphosphate-sugar epimerase